MSTPTFHGLKLVLLVPTARDHQIHPNTARSWAYLYAHFGRKQITTIQAEGPSIDHNRNALLHRAMVDTDSRLALWLDTDNWTDPDPVIKGMERMLHTSATVWSGLCRLRSGTLNVFRPNQSPPSIWPARDRMPIRVARIGTGCTLIDLKFFREMEPKRDWDKPWFASEQWHYPGQYPAWQGEDFVFSERVLKCGGSMYVDPTWLVGHAVPDGDPNELTYE